MLAATRRWLRRNRTTIAIGVGIVGAGYIVTSYVLDKLRDARERMSSDRIAKEKCVLYSLEAEVKPHWD
jgi:peroxin-3